MLSYQLLAQAVTMEEAACLVGQKDQQAMHLAYSTARCLEIARLARLGNQVSRVQHLLQHLTNFLHVLCCRLKLHNQELHLLTPPEAKGVEQSWLTGISDMMAA